MCIYLLVNSGGNFLFVQEGSNLRENKIPSAGDSVGIQRTDFNLNITEGFAKLNCL